MTDNERTETMGLLRGIARTAAIAGTATAVSNRVSRRQAGRWAAKEQKADQEQQAQDAQQQPQYAQHRRRSTPSRSTAPPQYAQPPRRPPTTCSSNCRSSAS